MMNECACRSLTGRPRSARAIARAGVCVWALALVLLPKCPICGMAYLSLTGLAALPLMPGWERWWPLIAVGFVFNVCICLRQLKRHTN